MARVKSDEIHDDEHSNAETPSPIGAGLPLLQRLRLLKEKQVSFTLLLFKHQKHEQKRNKNKK
jgi:hypothetical protein